MLHDIERLNDTLNHATNIGLGAVIGSFHGARGSSAADNLLWSGGIGIVSGGINTLLGNQRFFSKDTLINTLVFTASSAAMHFLAKSASDRRLEAPKITFAPSCGCKHKSWAAKVSEPSMQTDIGR